MLPLLLTAAALGLAGFDPLGLVALVAAMAMRARRPAVATLMAVTLGSTMLFGIIPALTLGPAVWRLGRILHHVSHLVWGPLVVVVGLGLLGWGVLRLAQGTLAKAENTPAPRAISPAAMALTGLLVGLSAFIDPAFYAGIVLAARQPPLQAVAVVVVWVLMSQSALVVVGLATLLGLYQPVHRAIETARARWGRALGVAWSVLLVAAGLLCVAQGVAEWHGHWLPMPGLHHRPR